MILSHRHRFIFIKTRKTAGTSVEISLSRYCGPKDVLTPLTEEDEVLRASVGQGPRNHEWDPLLLPPGEFLRRLRPGAARPRRKFFNHMGAAEIRRLAGERVWSSYFKFCFVRNPFDQFLSQYHWARGALGYEGDLDRFLEETLARPSTAGNLGLYTIDGSLAVDFVGRYENLEQDLRRALERVGIEFDGWLPRAKSAVRTDRRGPGEVLSPEQVRRLGSWACREIEMFGYGLPGERP